MSKTLAKKAFAVASSSALIVASFATFTAQAAVHAAGTNVISNGTVYFIDPSGVRRGYTSEGAFLSYGFNSWGQVVPASAEDLALPVSAAFVPPADGSLILDHGTIYLIVNGQRAGFTTMNVFSGLGYKLSNVKSGDTSFMSAAANVDSTSQVHPVGSLVNQSGTVYLMGPTGKMGIPSEAVFNSWGYSWNWVVPANAADNAVAMSAGIMPAFTLGSLSPFHPYTGGTTPIPVVTGNVSVSAASDMPASSAVITSQAAADLAHFTFFGNGTVTAVNLKRIGVSADTSLSNVYLYDGNTRLTDATSVSGSSMVNFTNSAGLFTVNGSKTISVKADLAASAGETLGVQLVSAMTGSTAVSGTPISGNLMSVATATLAGVSFGSVTPGTASISPANDQIVWQSTATVSTRNVLLTRLAMQEIGSINYTDINNFRLYVDGTQVAQVQNLDANGYVTFVPSSPVTLTTGARVIKVLANVIGGSSRTFSMSVRTKADIGLVDSQYNAGIATSSTVPLTSGVQTISSGSLTVQKTTDSPAANVTLNASDVPLARWTFTAYGEPVKITTLAAQATMTTNTNSATSLKNGRFLFTPAGQTASQYGSTQNVAVGGDTSYTVNYTVTPGTPVTVEFRADVNGNVALAANDTISIRLSTGSSNGQGTVSGTVLNVPTANTAGNTVTAASGATITLAKTTTYGNQNTVVPQTAYKLADYQLTGSSTEDVNVNTISVDFTNVTGGAADFTSADLSNVYVMWNGVRESVTKATVTATGNTWSVNHVLAKNGNAQVQIYADIGSTITANEGLKSTTTISGTTAQSGVASTTAAVDSQTITYKTGTIAGALDASSPSSANLDDNTTSTVAAYKITATNDAYTITDVTLAVNAATTVSSVVLRDGSTVLGTKPGATSVTFSGLSDVVAAGTNKVLTVDLVLGNVGTGAGATGENVTVTLTSFKTTSSGGTVATTSPGTAGNAMYVYHAEPTITNATSGLSSVLAAGTASLYKFTISTNGTGTISWKKIVFTVTKTAAPGLASFSLVDSNGTAVAGAFTPVGTFTAAGGTGGTQAFVATNEQEISGSQTYTLKATVSGTITAGTDSVTTNIAASGAGYVAPAAYATVAATTATFAWSDEGVASHSATTLDWNNDNLVKNIATDSFGLH